MTNTGAKKYLKLLMVIGVIALVGGGAGTFASFNAQTTNGGNTFATGTLLLSDSVKAGTLCYSNEASSNEEESKCSAVIDATEMKPGEGKANDLTIKNVGTLASSDLKLWGSSCVNETTGSFPGSDKLAHTGDVCGTLLFSLERDEEAGGAKPKECLVGHENATTHACDEAASAVSLKTWLETTHPESKPYEVEKEGKADKLAAGSERFYKIYLYLPSTADNTFQGRTGKFDLTWRIDQ